MAELDSSPRPTWMDDDFLRTCIRNSNNLPSDTPIQLDGVLLRFAVPKGENYMSLMYRISVEYRMVDGEKRVSSDSKKESFVCKVTHDEPKLENLTTSFFDRETEMFMTIIPAMQKITEEKNMKTRFICRCLNKITEGYPRVLVLDDLDLQGYKVANRHTGLDLKHFKFVLSKLAKFHAASKFVVESMHVISGRSDSNDLQARVDFHKKFLTGISQNGTGLGYGSTTTSDVDLKKSLLRGDYDSNSMAHAIGLQCQNDWTTIGDFCIPPPMHWKDEEHKSQISEDPFADHSDTDNMKGFADNSSKVALAIASELSKHENKYRTSINFLEKYADCIDVVFKNLVPYIPDHKFNAINHVDFWVNNMMFRYAKDGSVDDVIFVDFQIAHHTSVVRDFIFFFATSGDMQVRSHHFDEVKKFYLDSLNAALTQLGYEGDLPTEEEFDEELKRSSLVLILALTIFLPMILAEHDSKTQAREKSQAFSMDEMAEIADKTLDKHFHEVVRTTVNVLQERGLLDKFPELPQKDRAMGE